MSNREGFTYRALLGWVSEFVNRPLPGPWPQTPLDDCTIDDLVQAFDMCRESGYTHVALWGLFVDRHWPADVVSACSDERRKRIRGVVEKAHESGLRVLSGVGLYSWGFEDILRSRPELGRGGTQTLCPSIPESHEIMGRILDFLMDDFGFDGLNMQSADQGRCGCFECAAVPSVEYHARLYRRSAARVRERMPNAFLVADNWGCPIPSADDVRPMIALSSDLDVIIDTDNSAASVGPRVRSVMASQMTCSLGTLAGRSVWPPQWWEPDRWFLPVTLENAAYLRGLWEDGGRAVEQFVTTVGNPSGEISMRFTGLYTADPTRNPADVLRDAVSATYRPMSEKALEALVDVVTAAERAYFDHSNRPSMPEVGLFFVDDGFLSTLEVKPAGYLSDMTPDGRKRYASLLQSLIPRINTVRSAVAEVDKLDSTIRCLTNAVEEARMMMNGSAGD